MVKHAGVSKQKDAGAGNIKIDQQEAIRLTLNTGSCCYFDYSKVLDSGCTKEVPL